MLLKIQFYILTKIQEKANKQIKKCLICSEEVVPKKQVSIFNLLIYLIIGIVVFVITNKFASLLIPVGLGILNGILTKPRCPKCKKINFEEITWAS